jgi:4-hydroxybenzoate polyprenyltransferase
LREALLSAFGYFIVAIACTLAGYATGHQHLLPLRVEWPTFVLFFAVMFPAYANRAILYELKLRDFGDHILELAWLKSFSIHVPVLLFAEGGGIASLLFLYVTPPSDRSFIKTLTRIIVTAIPMYSIGARLTAKWPRDNALFGFLHRSFFPAFATCLTPFVFGYAGYGDTKCCVWSTGCILLFWALSLRWSVFWLALLGTVCLALLAVEQLFWLDFSIARARCATVIFFGTLMTLAMGVAESWRVCTRVQRNDIFRKVGPFNAREKSLYLGCTNFATSIFLPCFLLTALHPSTKGLYLVTVLALFATLYCFWLLPEVERKLSWPWPTLGVVFGLLVPVIVTFETQFPRSDTVQWIVPLWRDLSTTLGVIASDVTLVAILTSRFIRSISKTELPYGFSWVSFFEPPIPCICLTGTLSGILSILIAIASHLAIGPLVDKPRLAALNDVYMLIAFACAIGVSSHFLYKKMGQILSKRRPLTAATPPDSEGTIQLGRIFRTLKGTLLLVRPATSLIAGFLAGVVVFRGGGTPYSAFSAGASISLATAFGFVLDDLSDLSWDRRTGKITALTANQITVSRAKLLACCMAVSAVIISPGGMLGQAAIALTLIALAGYQFLSKVLPVSKGFYTATLSCIPLFYGALLTRLFVPVSIYAALWIFILGRELLIDVDQAEADLINDFHTFAVLCGPRAVKMLADAIMLFGLGLLLVSAKNWGAILLSAATSATVICILYSSRWAGRRPTLLRLALALGVGAIALLL